MWRSSTVPCFLSLNLLQTMLDLFWIRREHSAGGHSISTFPCKHRGYLSSISGACLTRLGYSIDAVQLIGRWGSDAIKRYIQDSPLVRPLQRTEHRTDDHIRKIVQDQMTRSFNQFWIVHSNSGITHIPAITETCTDNRRWHTICGWHYGTSTFQKTYVRPDTNRCLKCFRYTDDRDTPELDLSGSDTDDL